MKQGEERKGPEPRNPESLVLFSAVGSVAGTLSRCLPCAEGRLGGVQVLPALRICERRPDFQSPGNLSEMESIPWDCPSRGLDHILCDIHS